MKEQATVVRSLSEPDNQRILDQFLPGSGTREVPPEGKPTNKKKDSDESFRAGDGTRTHEYQLGRLMPYHLATPAYSLLKSGRLAFVC